MPERTKIVHYCKRCGKEMDYKDKKMLYLYDICEVDRIGSMRLTRLVPKKRRAINLCSKCMNDFEKILQEFIEGAK